MVYNVPGRAGRAFSLSLPQGTSNYGPGRRQQFWRRPNTVKVVKYSAVKPDLNDLSHTSSMNKTLLWYLGKFFFRKETRTFPRCTVLRKRDTNNQEGGDAGNWTSIIHDTLSNNQTIVSNHLARSPSLFFFRVTHRGITFVPHQCVAIEVCSFCRLASVCLLHVWLSD